MVEQQTLSSRDAWRMLKESTNIDFVREYVRSPPPVPTGIPALDDGLGGGIPTSTFTAVAGEPGTGKSAMACVAMYHAAIHKRYPIYYSFEMPATMVISRMLSIHTKYRRDVARAQGVPYDDWMEQVWWSNTQRVIENNVGKRISTEDEVEEYIRCFSGRDKVIVAYEDFKRTAWRRMAVVESMRDIEFVCQHVATMAQTGLPILPIIDYVQLGASGDAKEYERLSAASRMLQQACKTYRVPMIVISSMRNIKRDERAEAPTLSMLRGSGNIGYDAGTVIMLQRDAKKEREMKEAEGEDAVRHKRPIIAHIIKNRVGPSGIAVPLTFNGGMNHFE